MNILFDLDDTLLDHENAVKIAAQLFWREFRDRLSYDEKTFPRIWQEAIEKYYPLFNDGMITFQEQRRLRIREIFLQSRISDEEADQIFTMYIKHYENNWRLFNDVIPCLDNLSRYRLGVITNGNSVQQRQKLEHLRVKKYFDDIFISEEIGFSKPEPEIFLTVTAQLGCEPTDCIYIGDDIENDVVGSNAVGMYGIWLNRNKKHLDEENIKTIHSLDELKEKIESICCPKHPDTNQDRVTHI